MVAYFHKTSSAKYPNSSKIVQKFTKIGQLEYFYCILWFHYLKPDASIMQPVSLWSSSKIDKSAKWVFVPGAPGWGLECFKASIVQLSAQDYLTVFWKVHNEWKYVRFSIFVLVHSLILTNLSLWLCNIII